MPGHPEALIRTLPSGAHLVLLEDPSARTSRVEAWFDFGAADERPDERGACHAIEHLLFRRVRRDATERGGLAEASTSHDSIVFSLHDAGDPGATLRALLEALAPAPGEFDAFETERGVLRAEVEERAGRSMARLRQDVQAVALGAGHPYSRPVEGTAQDLEQLTEGTLERLRATWMTPDRLTLVAEGPAHVDRVVESAAAALSTWPARSGPSPVRPVVAPTPPTALAVGVRPARRHSYELALAAAAPAEGDPGQPAAELAAAVLTHLLDDDPELRSRMPYGAPAHLWTLRQASLFTAEGLFVEGEWRPTLTAMGRVLGRASYQPRSPAQLRTARNRLGYDSMLRLEGRRARVSEVGHAVSFGLPAFATLEGLEATAAVTPEQICATLAGVLAPDRLALGLAGPKEPGLTPEAAREAFSKGWQSGRAGSRDRPVPRDRPPAQRAAPAAPTRGDTEHRFDGGGRLHVEAAPSERLCCVTARFRAGWWSEPSGSPGISSLLAASLHAGGLADRATALGGEVWIDASFGGLDVYALAPLETLPGVVKLLRGALDLDRRTRRIEAEARDEAADFDRDAWAGVALFGDSVPTEGERLEGLESTRRQQLNAFARSRVRAGDALISACGPADPEWLFDALAPILSRLPRGTAAPALIPAPNPRGRLQRVRARANSVGLVTAGPHPNEDDFDALVVVARMMEDALLSELRDARGLSWSPTARVADFGRARSALVVAAHVAPEEISSARAALAEALRLPELPTASAVEAAGRRVTLANAIDLQDSRHRTDARCSAAMNGLEWRHADRLGDRIAELTPEHVGDLWRRMIDPDHAVELITGPDGS